MNAKISLPPDAIARQEMLKQRPTEPKPQAATQEPLEKEQQHSPIVAVSSAK